MAMFLVLRDLPSVTRDQYSAAQEAIADAARRASLTGRDVSYVGGYFLPGTGRAVCVFSAESASDVAEVNQRAGVSFTEVLEAIELRPTPVSGGGLPAPARTLGNQRGWSGQR